MGAVALAAALALVPSSAGAAGRAERSQGCPAPYLVHGPGKWDRKAVRRARHWNFQVHRRNLTLKPSFSWKRDPYESRRFRGSLASLGWLDVLFYDFRHNDRPRSLRMARDIALDWIDSHRSGNGGTDRTWDDRISATRATYLAYAMRASECRGMLNHAKRRRLGHSIARHARLAASRSHCRPTNHGLYVDTNLILLARSVPGIAKGRAWGRIAKRRFGHTLRGRIVEDEGFWLEHSTFYQLAIRKEVAYFRELAAGQTMAPLLKRMTEVAGWLIEPDGKPWLLGSTNNLRPQGVVKQDAADDSGLAWLGRSGLGFVKSAGGYLAVASTFFNGSHKHSDDLSFDLYDRGRRIVTDSGEFDKDPGAWGAFARSAAAHSTLTVDGESFSQDKRDAYGSGLLARGQGDGWFAILGKNPLLRRQGVGHERLLLYNPGLGLLVADRVRSRERHTYRRYFQLGSELAAKRRHGGVNLSDGTWSGRLEDETRSGNPGLILSEAKRHPRILGFEFPEFRQRVPRPTATLHTRGADLDHLAALDVDPAKSLDAKLIRLGGTRTKVRMRIGGGPAKTLEVVRHGEHLNVRMAP